MTLAKIKKLTLLEIEALHSKAVEGDRKSVPDFVRFSIWRSIERNLNYPDRMKSELYHSIVNKIKIKVQHG